jgi:hypothetical protein
MMGLLISDSFKAVVTIYILIPFLIIPQIILSGVLVKFEKLNPNISSPVSIPFYGEMITARWGYEALAVRQFTDNEFARKFYKYDKSMSEARFGKDYWCSKLKGNLDKIMIDLNKGSRDEDFDEDLLLVYNEVNKEMSILPEIKFDQTEYLLPERITPEVVTSALAYVETVRKYNVKKYNDANDTKDALITKLESEDKKDYQELRNNYFNISLEELVTSKNETQKTIDFGGELEQKLDPIYMDPKYQFIKAHFYSPSKQAFGFHIDTYAINVLVIWIMTFVLYLLLYLRVLKKTLNSGEKLLKKKRKIAD